MEETNHVLERSGRKRSDRNGVDDIIRHLEAFKCSPATTRNNNDRQALTMITIQLRLSVIAMAFVFLVRMSNCGLVGGGGGSSGSPGRMVRLCIASVDPAKLSSQCVMCNRRDFPLTVIDCTGITKVNDLIANPLSVREATCLIYNCRRQIPDIKPEPYHGSVSHAANYHRGIGAAAAPNGYPVSASGSQLYEMMSPSGLLGGGYNMGAAAAAGSAYGALGPPLMGSPAASPYMSRYGLASYRNNLMQGIGSAMAPISSMVPKGLIGGPSLVPDRQQALPYALVPAPSSFLLGSRKYKAALVPLFK